VLTRRQFLSRGALAAAGTAGTALAFPGDIGERDPGDRLPDGSASRGMINRDTDKAINDGLAYLNSRPRQNGYGTNNFPSNIAITSLAGLAFMANGSHPGRGPYARAVSDCLNFVLANSHGDGIQGYLKTARDGSHGPMYGHGFGTLFLGEVYGMAHDKSIRDKVKDTLKHAVQLIVNRQNREGGWRYTPRNVDADLSVTICQIMALRSARNAGIAVPKATVERCVKYVKNCQRDDGSFLYQLQGGGPGPPFARTAAGLCALYSAGIYKGREIENGLRYLINYKPSGRFQHIDMHYFYGHYYAVQAMWTAGGDYWAQWYPSIRDDLISRQRNDGSWPDFCNHYGTAMACIILQVPNNYLPILQK
jgi:hypothetical protein